MPRSNAQAYLALRDCWDGKTSPMSAAQLVEYQQLQRKRAPGAAAPGAAWLLYHERLLQAQVRDLLWCSLFAPRGGRASKSGIFLPPYFAAVQDILQGRIP